jgi:hypothetical protein
LLVPARPTLPASVSAKKGRWKSLPRNGRLNGSGPNADRLRADLARARAMGSVRRFFTGLHRDALEREAASAEMAAQAAADAARALAADIPRCDVEISVLRAEIAHRETQIRGYPPLAEIENRVRALNQRLGPIRERISAIDREIGALY